MALIHISGPSEEPITAAQVKDAGRIDGTEFDAQLAVIIPALRSTVEHRLGRMLVKQTKELVIDRFPPGEIDLQLPDVRSIVSLKYIDPAGDEQTLPGGAYSLEGESTPAWLHPAYGTAWPDTLEAANAVRVRFEAGYASVDDVPKDICLWLIAHAVQAVKSPDGVSADNIKTMPFLDGLLDPYKIWRVA